MATLGSPFTAGSAVNLPDVKITGKLVIRVDDTTSTDRIYVSTNGRAASSTNAQFFLNAGEALEICGLVIKTAAQVSITAGSGTPAVFWGES